MAHNRQFSETPLVSLEAGKLLGMRQVAQVSAGSADGASRDPAGSAGGAVEARAETSRLLSKIDETDTASAGIGAADSRAEMSRLLSKVDETGKEIGAADSRAKMSRLLSKVGIDGELPPPEE